MKNREILALQTVLNQVRDQPIRGGLKFKLLKLYQSLEPSMRIIAESLEGATDEDVEEILDQEQTVETPVFTEAEFESLELSLAQLSVLIDLTGGELDA